eukprot:s1464_g3.t1
MFAASKASFRIGPLLGSKPLTQQQPLLPSQTPATMAATASATTRTDIQAGVTVPAVQMHLTPARALPASLEPTTMWWETVLPTLRPDAPIQAPVEDKKAALEVDVVVLEDNLVLKKDGSILLVDFEYSAPGQPLMDLAVLAMGCSLTADEERSLLSAYLGKELSESDHYRFKAVRVLAALRETFWGVTAELSQSSALTAEEAIAYADMNFGKFTSLREAPGNLNISHSADGQMGVSENWGSSALWCHPPSSPSGFAVIRLQVQTAAAANAGGVTVWMYHLTMQRSVKAVLLPGSRA